MGGSHWVVITTPWGSDRILIRELSWTAAMQVIFIVIRSSTITEKARSGQIIHVDVHSADDNKGEPVKEMVMVLKVLLASD
jgi:hypothetical protein